MTKWADKYVALVTAVARSVGPFGVGWGDVADELGVSAKAAESAFWRLDNEKDGQASVDARILKHRIRGVPYARMLPDFPGLTIEDLKDRAKILAGLGDNNKWISGLRLGFLDIETSHLKSDLGIMLSWAIKEEYGETEHDVITRKEAIDWDKQDRRITESILAAIPTYDMLVTWNGTMFDIPAIRTRAEWWKMDNPLEFGDILHYDPLFTSRSKLNLRNNRLVTVAEFFGIEGKSRIPVATWQKARLGYADALEYVLEHNIADCDVLEQVYHKLKRFKKMVRKSA